MAHFDVIKERMSVVGAWYTDDPYCPTGSRRRARPRNFSGKIVTNAANVRRMIYLFFLKSCFHSSVLMHDVDVASQPASLSSHVQFVCEAGRWAERSIRISTFFQMKKVKAKKTKSASETLFDKHVTHMAFSTHACMLQTTGLITVGRGTARGRSLGSPATP